MNFPKIRVLSDQTINQIAAGEVIENPASVVKELVENSLDAGATKICVEIQGGGRELIRVSDDGCGMTQDDALLCLERHATSKIRDVEDLQELLTMGFRGEAIPSIASISKMSVLTRPNSNKGDGTLIHIEGGKIVSCSSVNCSPGTTIEVKSLFYNVPVRRKFQKSPTFDTQEILKMLGLLTLAYPAIQFELISDQKSVLRTTANVQKSFHDLLNSRLENIFSQEIVSSLYSLELKQPPYEIEGFISSSTSHKPNRTGQHLFINQRLVFSPLFSAIVREGYGTMLPNHRYPLFVLHLRMPGALIDVNVHPQKKEIRLRQIDQLKEFIIHAIQTTLRREQQIKILPSKDLTPIPPFWNHEAFVVSTNHNSKNIAKEEAWEYQPHSVPHPPSEDFANTDILTKSLQSKSPPLPPNSLPIETPSRILATLVGYCILDPFNLNRKLFPNLIEQREGGIALLDQRAAYARIHYEQLMQYSSPKERQSLLIPLTLELTPSEVHAVREHLVLLNRMGFELREFGEHSFLVDAFPHFLKQEQLQTSLSLIIEDLVELQNSRRIQMEKEKHLALIACRASLPTNKRLDIEEAQSLLNQLLTCKNPVQCPMGKPTCLYITPDEIAKWFHKG